MKRKIFSKLLMGAFLIASVSSFVSCKDYDDDINNLQKQIDAAALKAELTTLQQTLAAQIAAAQGAAEKAQAAAEAAQKTADNAATKEALESVKTIATNAGTAAGQAIADAANAKAAADAAQTTANNAGTAAEKAAADAAKAIADAAAAQNTANVAQTAAAAAQKAAEVAQSAADGANANATKALADAATALANAAAAQDAAKGAQGTADAATASAKAGNEAAAKAQSTAETAVAAAANAAAQAAEALAAAQAAQVAAAEATNSNENLRALLEKANKYADDAAAAALKSAEAALAASEEAAAAKDEAAEAKKAVEKATEAITEATKAKIAAAVAEINTKIDEAVDAQNDALAAAVETFEADLQTVADRFADYATAEALEEAVAGLQEGLEAAVTDATVAAAAAAAGTIKEAVAQIYSAVTSVELIASYSGQVSGDLVTFPLGFGISTGESPVVDLDFIFGKQAWDATFGDKETESLDDDADPTASYKKGDDIRAKRALLVRVNPSNAEISADQIKFIDSQLNNLDEIVKVGTPYRFEGLITRSTMESGLWVVPVEVVKGTDFNKFNETTFYSKKGFDKEKDYAEKDEVVYTSRQEAYQLFKGNLKINKFDQKLYAIAINNTASMEDAEDEDLVSRYVTSTFDLAVMYDNFTPATTLDANVGDGDTTPESIENYHNRWTNDVDNNEDKPGIRSCDQLVAYTLSNPEKVWAQRNNYAETSDDYRVGLRIPAAYPQVGTYGGADHWNTVNADENSIQNDYRYDKPFYYIEETGTPIQVQLPKYLRKKVEYWYISFDFEKNAVESRPSEWEAWQSYQDEIDGIYKLYRGGETIDLIINDKAAQGDVIGFRVWAVNYDGSLVDPDGRAFYVKIGKEVKPKAKSVIAKVHAVDAEKDMDEDILLDKDVTYNLVKEDGDQVVDLPIDKAGFNISDFETISLGFGSLTYPDGFSGETTVTREDENGTERNPASILKNESVTVYWALLDKDKKIAKDWSKIAYIRAGIAGEDLWKIVDGQTIYVTTLKGERGDSYNKEKYELEIFVKKEMPSYDYTKLNHFKGKIVWKSDYDLTSDILTVYPKPYVDNQYNNSLFILKPNYKKDRTPSDFYWNYRDNAEPLINFISDLGDNPKPWLNWDYTKQTIPANAGVRAFQDYIAEVSEDVDMDLYKFVINDLPTGIKDKAKADFTTFWEGESTTTEASKSIFGVLPEVVKDEQKKPTKLKYIYEGISDTYNAKTKEWANAGDDYIEDALRFETQFRDAMDLLTYGSDVNYLIYDEWVKNQIQSDAITGQKYKQDNHVYLTWLGGVGGNNLGNNTIPIDQDITIKLCQLALQDATAEGTYATADANKFADQIGSGKPYADRNAFSKGFSNGEYYKMLPEQPTAKYFTAGSGDLTTFLKPTITEAGMVLAENTKDGNNAAVSKGAGIAAVAALNSADYYTNWAFKPSYYSYDNPATENVVENAMKIELTGEAATYLRVSENATVTELKLQKKGGVNNPTRNIPGTIKLSGYDTYGKYHHFELPLTILFNF